LRHAKGLHTDCGVGRQGWPSDEELGLLKKLGVGIVHNPQSNMKLASGTAPIPQMLKENLPVGLGTDGAASNNDLNLWEEMDTAAKLHKLISRDPKVVPAEEAFEMATIRGARALHLDKEIGSIEKGKRADLVIVDLDDLNQTPWYNIYSDLVYATKADDVRTVIIEGRVVMRDRRLLTLNEETIKSRTYCAIGRREDLAGRLTTFRNFWARPPLLSLFSVVIAAIVEVIPV